MTEPHPPKRAANEDQVTIEFNGRLITGMYSVWADAITLRTALGSKTTQVGGTGSKRALEWVARTMLRELALDGKA